MLAKQVSDVPSLAGMLASVACDLRLGARRPRSAPAAQRADGRRKPSFTEVTIAEPNRARRAGGTLRRAFMMGLPTRPARCPRTGGQ